MVLGLEMDTEKENQKHVLAGAHHCEYWGEKLNAEERRTAEMVCRLSRVMYHFRFPLRAKDTPADWPTRSQSPRRRRHGFCGPLELCAPVRLSCCCPL
jgi:hypothetical protein